ncbi:MAG: gamma subclass chorismate mutase AroQ [Balneolaceae bacterium]
MYSKFLKFLYRSVTWLFVLFVISFCNKSYTAHEEVLSPGHKKDLQELALSINTRLSYMKDVAAYKWENKIPIEDKAREVVVIQASQESALQNGLDTLTTRVFFELQITLAKQIQEYWFAKWEASGESPSEFKDLQEVVRPELIKVGNEIIQKISASDMATYRGHFINKNREAFTGLISTEGLSTKNKEELFEAVTSIIN